MRIGFDLDGVLADFRSAFRDVEARLFGSAEQVEVGEPEKEAAGEAAAAAEPEQEASPAQHLGGMRELQRRRAAVWVEIRSRVNFWESLAPIEPGAVARIHAMMLRHRWEVFFITQRPDTEGDTVQRQTQRWLVRQGFDLPSVLVIRGSRGTAARALQLDYHVDDNAQNCIDIIADSTTRPMLVLPGGGESAIAAARTLGIATVASIGECLDVLEKASDRRSHPGLLQRLAASLGWK